eukprot:6177207-Pleurochrysis_carterae.AAC.2
MHGSGHAIVNRMLPMIYCCVRGVNREISQSASVDERTYAWLDCYKSEALLTRFDNSERAASLYLGLPSPRSFINNGKAERQLERRRPRAVDIFDGILSQRLVHLGQSKDCTHCRHQDVNLMSICTCGEALASLTVQACRQPSTSSERCA